MKKEEERKIIKSKFLSEGWSLKQQTNDLAVNDREIGSFSSNESNQIASVPMLFAEYKGTAVSKHCPTSAGR